MKVERMVRREMGGADIEGVEMRGVRPSAAYPGAQMVSGVEVKEIAGVDLHRERALEMERERRSKGEEG